MRGKDKKEKKEKGAICEVCHLKYFEGEVFEKLTCSVCERIVHRNCYIPDFKERAKFKCDECKHPKSK
jgi:hypothetical protein